MTIDEQTVAAQPRVAHQLVSMVRGLGDITDGFSVDQMEHALQTATRAERDGADEEVVVASLLHDVGKLISVANHPHIAAEILEPYVRSEVYCMVALPPGLPGSLLLRVPGHGPRPA